jgi:hypothetical protein
MMKLSEMRAQLALSERLLDEMRKKPRAHNLTRSQVENVCRHFGLSEWSECFTRLTIGDYRIEDRDFSRFLRKTRAGQECIKMLRTIQSESVIRECFGPEDIESLETALAISRGA